MYEQISMWRIIPSDRTFVYTPRNLELYPFQSKINYLNIASRNKVLHVNIIRSSFGIVNTGIERMHREYGKLYVLRNMSL